MNFTRIITILVLSSTIAFPKEKEKVQPPPPAPLPDRVLQAKTVMLRSPGFTNRAGYPAGDFEACSVAYDEAYKRLHEWGRFQVVGDPKKADLILVLEPDYLYSIPVFWPLRCPLAAFLRLTLVDPKTKLWVWNDTYTHALREKNRAKDTVLAVDVLIRRLRDRIPAK